MIKFLFVLVIATPSLSIAGLATPVNGKTVLKILADTQNTNGQNQTIVINKKSWDRALYCYDQNTKMSIILHGLKAGEKSEQITQQINSDAEKCRELKSKSLSESEKGVTIAVLAPLLSDTEIYTQVGQLASDSTTIVIQSPDHNIDSLVADLQKRFPSVKITVAYGDKK